jgi:glycosyltransferase involved in cell wall biosynthesis
MQIDVVIPARDRPDLLAEAIASVLTQSHSNLLLWIVDDGSKVPLESVVSHSDSRIRWLRLEESRGPAFARNLGAGQGVAPYVAFLDSDDLWRETKLAQQLALLTARPELRWIHTDETWMRDGVEVKQKSEHRKEGGQFIERAIERCLISASAVMFRRDFFEQSGGFNPHFPVCEDYELWLRLLQRYPIGFIPYPLVIKRTGNWPQLSATPEIDRYRVLALHRFYRQKKTNPISAEHQKLLFHAAEKKCQFLIKGAQKYKRIEREKRYQAWLILFSTLRTRDIR